MRILDQNDEEMVINFAKKNTSWSKEVEIKMASPSFPI